MMNNCQKCGNPLQPGVTICPICGTNRSEVPVDTAQASQVGVLPNQTNLQGGQNVLGNVGPQTVTVAPTSNNVSMPNPMPTVETLHAMPTGASPSSTISTGANTNVMPNQQPSLNTIAPSVSLNSTSQPIPNVPAGTTIIKEETPVMDKKAKKKGFGKNQKVIIIAAAVVVVLVVVFMMMSSQSMKPVTQTPQTNTPNDVANGSNDEQKQVALKEAITNGYKLKYEEGWVIEEDSYNVLLKKSDDSVIMKLEHFAYDLSDFDKAVITSYLGGREGITNAKVEEITISGKNAYHMSYDVNTQTSTSYPVESYFINGGTNLILGATVVYLSESVKEANAASVLSLMNNISYADESLKALDSINMYYNAFSLYADIIGNSKIEETPEVPEEPVVGTPEGESNGDLNGVTNDMPNEEQNPPLEGQNP